jgi:hypothetical protein
LISVPYWTDGDAAAAALEKAYYLALMVERETGLEGCVFLTSMNIH